MKKIKVLLLLTTVTALSACDSTINTPDGKVPPQYLQLAQQYTGVFVGSFEGSPTTLTLALDGASPTLAVSNDNHDLVGRDCDSSIGRMTDVSVDKTASEKLIVDGLRFSLDRGQCEQALSDNHVTVRFDDANHFYAFIYRNNDSDSCYPGPDGDPDCSVVDIPLSGRFARK